LKKTFKQWIAFLKSNTKNLLKERLVFCFENEIKAMDRLAQMHGQEIVESTVRFSISKQD